MTCRSGSMIIGALLSAPFLILGTAAFAGEMPPIKISETNKVPACATPGRLMAFVRERNSNLDPKYDGLATEYMRHGEALALRWDYAFFQMLLETGYLTYKGDVSASQNNFAGLGATGRGARGESFKDVSTGVRAHLEHLLMYSGQRVENPVAERTRNVQDWGVLEPWHKRMKGPITFTQLAKQWAPSSRTYARDMEAIADRFFDGPCKSDDPQPQLVAEAREGGAERSRVAPSTDVRSTTTTGTPKQETAADNAGVATGRAREAKRSGDAQRFALGASTMVTSSTSPATSAASQSDAEPSPPVKLLNAAQPDGAQAKAEAAVKVAGVAGAAKDAGKLDRKAAPSNCRVWTASYGGTKAIIIKAVADKTVNYTVLDVNEGAEKREADAYISAYAKGGEKVGEFPNQSQALEKAFELCPEG